MNNKYIIPCPSCETGRLYSSYKTYSRALKQKDRVCYKCSASKRKVVKEDKRCIECNIIITNISNVMRCKSCAAKHTNSNPEIREKISKSLKGRTNNWGDKISKSLINHHNSIKNTEEYRNNLKNKRNYYNEVRRITNQQDISKLPNADKIGRGIGNDTYHLDHIVSKIEGFKNGIDATIIGNIKNLRVIKSKDNIKKGIIEQNKFSRNKTK